jgi:protein-disulfide isomerase
MRLSALAVAALSAASLASAAAPTQQEVGDVLKKNPQILLDVLKENRKALLDIVEQAAQEEHKRRQQEQAENEKKEFEESFKNPLKPEISKKTRIRGNEKAKYTLVEYSDFQCPYCAQGYKTVEALREKYGKDMRFVFKHLPLPFHPQAVPAAEWMEAVALQSPEKSWEFHDKMFQQQDKLGEDFYRQTVKELGLDVEKAAKDAKGDEVKKKIEADTREAKQLGFSGTPGFLLNGIPVKGAYPAEYFEMIVTKLEAKKN